MTETQPVAIIPLDGCQPLDAEECDTPIGIGFYVRYNDGCDDPQDAGRVTLIASGGPNGIMFNLTPVEARLMVSAIVAATNRAEDEIKRRKMSEHRNG